MFVHCSHAHGHAKRANHCRYRNERRERGRERVFVLSIGIVTPPRQDQPRSSINAAYTAVAANSGVALLNQIGAIERWLLHIIEGDSVRHRHEVIQRKREPTTPRPR